MLTGFVVVYILLTIGVGFWAARRIKHSDDFTLAGRSLSAIVVGVTIFATWFGPELIMGVPGMFVRDGLQGVVTDLFGNLVCLSLVAIFYARQLYRLKIVTINDFFRLRFGSKIETVTALINVYTYFAWIAAQFLALALLFNVILGVSVSWGIVLAGAIVMTYTYVGGMWAVSITDLIQSVLIVVGLSYVLMQLAGEVGGVEPLFSSRPEGFWNLLPEPGFYSWIDYIALWMTFGIGAIPAQEIYQRVLSARSERAAGHGAWASAGMLFFISCIPLAIALCISVLYPQMAEGDDAQNMIPAVVQQFTSMPVQVLFFGALISAILSTSSGAMLAPATVIGENLIKPHLKNITDRQLLLFTRLSVVFVAVISGGMAFSNSSIHGLVVASVILLLSCIIVPFTAGLYWKRASVAGAWASIVAGGVVWFVCMLLETRIEPWMFGMLSSAAAMLIASLLVPDDSRQCFERNFGSFSF